MQDKAVFLMKSWLLGEVLEGFLEIIEVVEAHPDAIHYLSVLLLHNFLASYTEMFAKAAYVRKLKDHKWMPKANVTANMVAIRRLHLEGIVIKRETAGQKIEKRCKVMLEEDAFDWLLARLPVSMLAWKDEQEADCETWDALVASLLIAEQKVSDMQRHVFSLNDVPVPDERAYTALAYAQKHAKANNQQTHHFKARLAKAVSTAKMGDCD